MTTRHLDSAGHKQSKKQGGAANLQAGKRLLSSVLSSREEEAHVVIAIHQHGANSCMQQISQQSINQLTQSDIKQHTEHADPLKFGVQSPPGADCVLQSKDKHDLLVLSDHVLVMQKGGVQQPGRKTVCITFLPQMGVKITSSNSQLFVRPDSSYKGEFAS